MDNDWAGAIKFWFEHVNEGYIVDLYIECNKSFNNNEKKIAIDPRKRLLE
jgi:hypothetical protein